MNEFDVFARFYDFDYGDYAEDIEFYLNFARRTGAPILDAACGTGRVLIPLAQDGFVVTGLDVSPAMIARAAAKVRKTGLQKLANTVVADLRDFRLDESFELAFVALNSFGHLVTVEDQVAALASLRAHLRDAGLLIIDLLNPDLSELAEASGQVVHEYSRLDPAAGNTIMKFVSTKCDPSRHLLDVTFFYDQLSPGGDLKRVVAPFPMRYFSRPEMELLLARAGFRVENVYGSYDLADYEAESPKMIYVARKT